MSSKDYYATLGVSKTASDSELKRAYRELARKYHPDHNHGDPKAEQKFKEINEAYDVLSDKNKRAHYDRFGDQEAQFQEGYGFNSSGQDFGSIFDVLNEFMQGGKGGGFSGFNSSTAQQGYTPARGSDLRYNLTIDLKEAFHGISKDISFSSACKCPECKGNGTGKDSTKIKCSKCNGRGSTVTRQGPFAVEQVCTACKGARVILKDPCSKCNGSSRINKQRNISVKIPAGIETGTKIRLTGEGEAGVYGGANGDLYVHINVSPHNSFKIEQGGNLHCIIPINFTIAILGGEIEVKTLGGEKLLVKIPPKSNYGDKLKIAKKGMPKVGVKDGFGDLYLHLQIELPKNDLTEKQHKLLLDLQEEFIGKNPDAQKTNPTATEDGFFSKMKNLWK